MGTPAKQIGWSTEANLLQSILKQVNQLTSVVSTSGGGGGGGGVSGTGTINYIPKWSSTTGLTDSLILDNGNNVGIGAIDTIHKFNVDGAIQSGGLYTSGIIIQTPAKEFIWDIQRGSSTGNDNFEILNFGRINVDFHIGNYTGNVIINSYTDNEIDKLQVNGSILGETINTTGFTVSTLPFGMIGSRTYVTDATAPIFGDPVVGGGIVVIPVFYDGTTWIVG